MSRKSVVCPMLFLLTTALMSGVACSQSVEEFDETSPKTKAEPSSSPPTEQPDLPKVAESIVKQTNSFRMKNDLRSLEVDPRLAETAQSFADFMARTGKYGHHADGQSPAGRADQHGYDYCIVLENIAYAYQSTGFSNEKLTSQFVEGWKNSEGHHENMLDPDIYETGVAVAQSEDKNQYFAVQMFGRPHAKAIRFQIANMADEEVEYSLSRNNSDKKFKLQPRARRTHTQCRPSQIDLGWTKKDDRLQVRDGRKFVVRQTGPEGLQVKLAESK